MVVAPRRNVVPRAAFVSAAFTLLFASSAGCGTTEASDAEIATATVTSGLSGSVSPSDDGAVGTTFACSAALVASRFALTAAHCTDPELVRFAPSSTTPERIVRARRIVRHPRYDAGSFAHDVAIVELDEEVDAPPLAIADAGASAEIESTEEIRVVGYGPGDGAFARREGRLTVSTRGDFLVAERSSVSACHGDSGGPAFVRVGGREVIVAVVSHGPASCDGAIYFARVDDEHDFIDPILAGDPRSEAACGQAPADARTSSGVAFVAAVALLAVIARRRKPRRARNATTLTACSDRATDRVRS